MAVRPYSLYWQCLKRLLTAAGRVLDVVVVVDDILFGVLGDDLGELLLGDHLGLGGFFDDPAADVEGG